MKARVSNLYKTEAEWNTISFTPREGELVVYAPDAAYNYARLKVGDGKTELQQLPFFTDECIKAILAEQQQAAIADGGEISSYFKD